MKKIYLLVISFIAIYTSIFSQNVNVSGALVGNGTYLNLGTAFTAINSGAQTAANILVTIVGNTTEATSAVLNQSAGPWVSLTISPSGGAIRIITGNIAGHLVDLNGADNVTIDGIKNSGNDLFIINTNTSASASAIRFVNDASNNTVTRTNVNGASGSAVSNGLGVIYFAAGAATGNDNNTISLCNISAVSAGNNPINGIYSMGTSAVNDNSGNTINQCNISDYFNAGAATNGININSNNSAWTVNGNTFYQTATRTYTTASTHNGIFVTSGSGYTVTNNFIGYSAPNQTGTTNMIGYAIGTFPGSGTFPTSYTPGGTANATRYNAINCAFTAGGVASSIQNNTIGGIALYTSSGAATTFGILCGIAVTSGNANIGTVSGNIIGSSTGSSSIYAASTTAGATVSGIYCNTTNSIAIQNNTIGGIDVSGTTAITASGFKGIEAAGTGTYVISSNNVGNETANNIRTGFLLTAGNLSNAATTPTAASGGSAIQGIVSTSTGSTLNIISNLVHGIQVSGTATTYNGITNSGAVTSTINLNNNQLGNIDAGAVNFMFASSGTIQGILNSGAASTCTINMNNNTIDDIVAVTSAQATLVWNFANSAVAINMKNNQLGGLVTGKLITYSGAQGSLLYAFANGGGTNTCVLTIQANDVRGINYQVTSSQQLRLIYNDFAVLSTNFLNNTFTNLSINNIGFNYFMMNNTTMASGASFTCNNNQISGIFSKTASGGQVSFLYTSGGSVTGSTITASANNFSNVTLTGSAPLFGWDDEQGVSGVNGPTKIITGNTFNNITMGTGLAAVIYIWKGVIITCSSNTVSNISGPAIFAINNETTGVGGAWNFSSNSIFNLNSTGDITALVGGTGVTSFNISNNTINNLSSSGANAIVTGIDGSATTANINDNLIYGLSGSGTTSPSANGILIKGGGTVNVFRNKLYDIAESGIISTTSPVVNGMVFSGGTTVTAYNNFIGDLKTPSASLTDAVRGIGITSTSAASTYNLYYNSVYINAASTGANFGTSGIYHTTSATATTARLNMVNNIIVNTSLPNGSGFTAAYRRSDPTLANFAATSDYNLWFAGVPSATKLIYYDGTNSDQILAAYQTRVNTRDANSISLLPTFISATDLHLTTANCRIDGRGTPIGSVTDDIDVAARNATTPDIGADEFTATTSTTLAGSVGSAICEDRTISATGTTYTSNGCDLIARVLPSGADPVGGKVNVCVTLDATQQSFNGDRYVQRHFDIEPVTSNQTTTSATITLYFTNAEFSLYNTNNPARPPLPTMANNTVATRNNVKVTQFHGTPTGGLPTSTPGNYGGGFALIIPGAANVILNGSVWAVTFNIMGFSGFYVHTNNYNAPLPIIINYLTGRRQGSNHLLNWKVTCATSPRATMTLERSADSRNFSGINTITADAARCDQPFDYTDADPLTGMNYYRLKIVDADGKVTYSTTVALLNAVKGFDIISIAPNPVVGDNFKLNVASAQAGKMEIVIFDMQGRLVNRQSISLIAGYNSLPVNVVNLAAGTYTIKGSMADDQTKVIRFVKQ